MRLPQGLREASGRAALLILVISVILHPSTGRAQVTKSGLNTLGTGVNPVGSPLGTTYNITGGSQRGGNLFHSFGRFTLPRAGDVANFCNAAACGASPLAGVSNIVGRVTGGEPSNIFGTIQTTGFGTASLWLVNPAGWIFGPTARLSVEGSFRVSTADYLRFSGGVFSAADSPLPPSGLTADPVAFGFLNPRPAAILVDATAAAGASLTVPLTQTLSLIGGEAPFPGNADTGITIEGVPTMPTLRTLGAPNGHIQIVSVASAGEVGLSPQLDVSSVPTLGQVNLKGAFVIVSPNAGDVVIRGRRIVMTDSTRIQANTRGADEAFVRPVVDVEATESVEISGGSTITSGNTGLLAGGALMIRAPSGSLTLSGPGTGIQTDQLNSFGGSGGDIIIQARTFGMSGGALIGSSATIKGGDVRVTATDSAVISGEGTGIFSGGSGASLEGDAGDIVMNVGKFLLTDAAGLTNGSVIGRSGDVTIKATDSIVIANGAGISSQAFGSDVGAITLSAPGSLTVDHGFISTSTSGSGNAGPISINVGSLALMNGGQIASSSVFGADGKGGDIAVKGAWISISGSADTPVVPGLIESSSGLFSTASGNGPGGSITVTSPQIQLFGGGRIDSSTAGAGRGGTIRLGALNGTLSVNSAGVFSDASNTGAGGDINVAAKHIGLTNATMSATSTGTVEAVAGNINLVFDSSLEMINSSITTDARLADGGNISIAATGSLLYALNSDITTSVESGKGGGGNITIGTQGNPVSQVVLDGSQILANAFGGPGGNINIFADVFLTQTAVLSASSALAAPGTVAVQAQVTDVTGALAQLPESIVEAAALLRASCMTRLAEGKASSLVVAGREGVPPAPDGALWSPTFDLGNAVVPPSGASIGEWIPPYLPTALRPRCEG